MTMKENDTRFQPPIVYVSEPTKWEYKKVTRNLDEEEALTENELNELGKAGWELAGVISESGRAYFYFKKVAE